MSRKNSSLGLWRLPGLSEIIGIYHFSCLAVLIDWKGKRKREERGGAEGGTEGGTKRERTFLYMYSREFLIIIVPLLLPYAERKELYLFYHRSLLHAYSKHRLTVSDCGAILMCLALTNASHYNMKRSGLERLSIMFYFSICRVVLCKEAMQKKKKLMPSMHRLKGAIHMDTSALPQVICYNYRSSSSVLGKEALILMGKCASIQHFPAHLHC